MKIDILYQFDENYAPFAGVSMTSLFENNRHFDDINIYILDNQIEKSSKDKICTLVDSYGRKVAFLDTKELEKKIIELGIPQYRGSYAANMRLFISELIPAEVERLVYFDSDTLITGALDEIVLMDMKDYPLAMVLDSLVRGHKKHLNLSKDAFYYNSGVIVFQMDKFRENKCTEQIVRHVKKVRAGYPNPDQDLLNVVCRDQILTLSPGYNLQPVHLAFSLKLYFRIYGQKGYYKESEISDALKNKVVVHFFRFVGEFPWNKDTIHPDTELFDQYLLRSLWSDYEKKSIPDGLIHKIERGMYLFLPKGIFLFIFRLIHEFFTCKENRKSLENK